MLLAIRLEFRKFFTTRMWWAWAWPSCSPACLVFPSSTP